MAYYLLQAKYTNEAWASLLKKPQNRLDIVRPVIEGFGGTIEHSWMGLDDDIVTIIEMPNNAAAKAFPAAGLAAGTLREIRLTALLTMEEGVNAMNRARDLVYPNP